MPLSPFQDDVMIKEITRDLHLNLGLVSDFDACNLYSSEAYAGTMVGQGFIWKHEIPVACLLASARLLQWDYELSLSNL
jgi:hypothetical protein